MRAPKKAQGEEGKKRDNDRSDLLVTASGATPIEPEELLQLLPGHLMSRADLNEWEAANIMEGMQRAKGSRKVKQNLLSATGILEVHKLMFSKTWRWAGSFRQRDVTFGTQTGIPVHQISTACHSLCQDVNVWIEYKSYQWREIAARFHHRLVLIHPFPNGNGRHSRHMTDLLLQHHDQPIPTWGGGDLVAEGDLRSEYLTSLREADNGSYDRLILFMFGDENDVHQAVDSEDNEGVDSQQEPSEKENDSQVTLDGSSAVRLTKTTKPPI